MAIDLHLDSVREVVEEICSLPAVDSTRHFRVRKGGLVLHLAVGPKFPDEAPRITTLNGLSLYKAEEWDPTGLLGHAVQQVLSELAELWGSTAPSTLDYDTIRNLTASCDDAHGLCNDSLARRSVLLRGLPFARAVSEATTRALGDLENSIQQADLMANSVNELHNEAEEIRSKCTLSTTRFPKGLGTKEGVSNAFKSLYKVKERSAEDQRKVTTRAARTKTDFDLEFSRLFSTYRDLHLLELKTKLVQSL